MRKLKFTESQILAILGEGEAGLAVAEVCRKHGISTATYYQCFHRLRADGHEWNHKKLHRAYCAMKLNLQRKAKKRVITRERRPLGVR